MIRVRHRWSGCASREPPSVILNLFHIFTKLGDSVANANDRSPKNKGRNFTVNIRMSREEIEAARKLGGGNISMGFRHAIRYAMAREMKPVALSTMLRSAAVMAQDLEQTCQQFKSDALGAQAAKRMSSAPIN